MSAPIALSAWVKYLACACRGRSRAGRAQLRSPHGFGELSRLSGAGGGGFEVADPPVYPSVPRGVRERPLCVSLFPTCAASLGGKLRLCSHVDSQVQ
eukprot:3271796-Pyramimonas_sp.AAC.1